MLGLLHRDQKTLVVLLWLILLGNLLRDNYCSIKCEPLIQHSHNTQDNRGAQATLSSLSNTPPETADPLAPYRVPGTEALMPFRVEINTAPAVELQLLPGVGPALAKTIIAWRETHDPFQHIEDIKLVPGIGPKKYKAMEKFIYIQAKQQ